MDSVLQHEFSTFSPESFSRLVSFLPPSLTEVNDIMKGPMRYRWPELDHIEDVEKYRPGGYHPVHLGDIFNGKYKILHKLGYGGFSTLWLARVLDENRYVALKVLIADATNQEFEFLTYLRTQGVSHPSIVSLQDSFNIQGPNGLHCCLVLDVVGPSVQKIVSSKIRLPNATIRSVAKRIASGIADLHDLGICHGDLTASNILLEVKDIQSWSEAEIYQHLGAPKTEPLLMTDGWIPPPFAPRTVVQAIQYSDFNPSVLSDAIRVIDFGQSFFANNPPAKFLGIPAPCFAPEMQFGFPASEASDVWALGCLIFKLLTRQELFPVFFGLLVEALGMAIDTLGPLPKEWQHSYCDATQWPRPQEGQEDHWFDPTATPGRSLESQLQDIDPKPSPDELACSQDLLRGALTYDPERRLSVRQVTSHRWFSL